MAGTSSAPSPVRCWGQQSLCVWCAQCSSAGLFPLFLNFAAWCCISTSLFCTSGAEKVPGSLQGAAQVPSSAFCPRCCKSTPQGLIFPVFWASVSTGETEAKTEATKEARKEVIFVVVVAGSSRLFSGCSLQP